MNILIACYPRVGSRYLNNKLNTCVNPHPTDQFYNKKYQKDIFKEEVGVISTHDRNIDYLYKNLNLKKTDILIHLIANPYNSVVSFFNAWPQKEYENSQHHTGFTYKSKLKPAPPFKLNVDQINPLPIEFIENCDNSFAIQTPSGKSSYFAPAVRAGHTPITSFTQQHNYQELMLRCDFLQYEHHFDRVINNNLDIRMITIKYEGLPKSENIKKLKKYLGYGFEGLNFNDFSTRKSHWRNSIFKNEIEDIYGPLYKKYSQLSDIKIWR